MKPQQEKSWHYYCQTAFTLVEVVASLMLLGTLLVGILTAHRKHTQQVRGAEARLSAVAAADQLLSEWREKGVWGAVESSGRFANRSDLMWRWRVTSTPELSRVGVGIGRLEIVGNNLDDARPLASVEILTTDSGEYLITSQSATR